MPIFSSNYLTQFSKAMHDAQTAEVRETLWQDVENPIIEDIPDQTDKLVTILYRLSDDELDGKTSIYFLSGVAGYDFTEKSKFSVIPQTDIAYISLVLPCQLRGAYNLVKRHDDDSLPVVDVDLEPICYPKAIGESAKFDALLNDLFAKDLVITDPCNKNQIVYYKDMDNPDEIYGKESILELPLAPCLKDIPTSFEAVKLARFQLRARGRLLQDKIQFSDTCLRSVSGYSEPELTRKYWVYLPPDYDHSASDGYPLLLLLDGSSYIDYIPAHCILEKMISDEVIPPCVAVFFDSPDGAQRGIEYNCNAQFTEFLAQDFMQILRVKHQLNITADSNQSTVIGASYGGLAAFYLGLTRPDIFGHVIAQSPAFLAQPLAVLDKMILDFAEKNKMSSFVLEIGRYENNEVEFEFEDGTVQKTSSFDVVRHIYEYMQAQEIPTTFHEFVGGHNYVCYRVSLYDRIKEVCDHMLHDDARHSPRH